MKRIPVNENLVISKIYLIRGLKVMIDQDLAEMYGVETRRLNEQVKRNRIRFPKEFIFKLTRKEYENLMSQNATSSWGGRRQMPYAFTEYGLVMLSGILNSKIAVQVNIRITKAYVKLREVLLTHKDLLLKLEVLEKKVMKQDQRSEKQAEEILVIFNALKELLNPESKPRRKIGFKV
jgi:hypothetical protein